MYIVHCKTSIQVFSQRTQWKSSYKHITKLVTASYKINKNKKHKTKNVRVFCFENILRQKRHTVFFFSTELNLNMPKQTMLHVSISFSHHYSFEILPIYLPRKAQNAVFLRSAMFCPPKLR